MMARQVTILKRKVAASGQALAETGLIIALVIVVAIVALNLMGGNISAKLTCLANGIQVGNKNNVNC